VDFLKKIWAKLKKLKDGIARFLRPVKLVFRTLKWVFVFFLSVTVLGLIYYVYFDLYFFSKKAPDIESFVRYEPPTIGTIYDSNGNVVIELAKDSQFRKIISYDKIPPVIVQAILSAEDKRFFDHWGPDGVDLLAVLRALVEVSGYSLGASVRHGELVVIRSQGASTITQQIVRLWFLPEIIKQEDSNTLIADNGFTKFLAQYVDVPTINSFTRKFKELRLAVWLEREMRKTYGSRDEAKKQMFTRFASYTYLGSGRYGV